MGKILSDLERIAALKHRLELRRERLKRSLEEVEELIKLVDAKLRSISFVTAEAMVEEEELPREEVVEEIVREEPERRIDLLTLGGEPVVTAEIFKNEAILQINPRFEVPIASGPVKYLLKSLDKLAEEDLIQIKEGRLKPEEKLTYSVEEREGNLVKVKVTNYRSEERLKDISGKARWAVKTLLRERAGE